MKKSVSHHASKLFLSVLSIGCALVLSGAPAFAQMEGCDPKVMDAMNKKATAKVAYDVSVTQQIIKKPDSVLAMTCFAQQAEHTAVESGKIFSDIDSTTPVLRDGVAPVIEEALEGMYDNYEDTFGRETGTVDYDPKMSAGGDCDAIQKLWDKVKTNGIEPGVPFATTEQLRKGAGTVPTNAGASFKDNWNSDSSQQAFKDLDNAMKALPKPTSTPNYSGANTTCEVLKRSMGTTPPGC